MLALGLIRSREKPVSPAQARPFILQWVRLPSTTTPSPTSAAPGTKTAAGKPSPRASLETASPPPATPRADDLMTAAHAAVHAEIQAKPSAKPSAAKETTVLSERPFMPQLERALQREAPGERYLGNGIIRIVTASGHSYCLKEPPPYARDIPSVPTNCP